VSQLTISNLEVTYGRIKALHGVSAEVREGEFVGLVGPNGAGKSTLVNSVAGVVPSVAGSVTFGDRSLTGARPEHIVEWGVSLVPEGRQIFARLTVRENLRLGATTRRDKAQVQEDLERVFQRFPILMAAGSKLAGKLSGGEQQQLAIARALLSRPKLLMLDEPSLGLAPLLIDEVFAWLRELHAAGTTILLVEQNAARTIEAADRTYVLNKGRIAGEVQDLEPTAETNLFETYLGVVENEQE
jgi:branched-chain amino acid transport system ATP-binding protein